LRNQHGLFGHDRWRDGRAAGPFLGNVMAKPATKPDRAPRLQPAVRERLIIDGAIRYFSANGWIGTTAGLARDLGIAQALLFRYFPTKDALIQRIYEEIEQHLFNPDWTALIEDETRPLQNRLVAFYQDYVAQVGTKDRFRLFLHESLACEDGHDTRYYGLMRRTIFAAMVRALRRDAGLSTAAPLTEAEYELVMSLHGMIQGLALRRWVYRPRLTGNVDKLVEQKVAIFLGGVRTLVGASPRKPTTKRKAKG